MSLRLVGYLAALGAADLVGQSVVVGRERKGVAFGGIILTAGAINMMRVCGAFIPRRAVRCRFRRTAKLTGLIVGVVGYIRV